MVAVARQISTPSPTKGVTSPFNSVLTEFGAVSMDNNATFHGILWEANPDPSHPVVSEIKNRIPVATSAEVFPTFAIWLKENSNNQPVFVSDNPAWDFQWISYGFDEAGMINPFGHSGRRISDFWAGLNGKWSNTQKWKRFRETKHDHNPVHDALGNAEALRRIFSLIESGELAP